MTPLLFDPLAAPSDAWPADSLPERNYIESLARHPGLIANVRTRWLALRSGARVLPVTVNEVGDCGSYVCLPRSAYVLYGRRELELVDVGPWRALLKAGLLAADALLRAARADRIVHLDNWALSTNLHGDWDGADLPAIRRVVREQFPRHLLAVRSVDPWSCPILERALRADGWLMLPSRQVWVVDDLARRWRRSTSTASDRALLRRSSLVVEDVDALRPGDAERISTLYRMLYVDKYSGLNPFFSPEWVANTQGSGLLRYRVARDPDGTIQSVVGCLVRAGVLTTPLVGYDTTQPVQAGLYRVASYLLADAALAGGWRLNASAGAAEFKRTRGARPVVECTAVWTGGLPAWRRGLLRAFGAMLWNLVVPVMQRRQL